MTPPDQPRCPAGARCALRKPIVDEAGARTGWEGAPLDDPTQGLCAADSGRLRYTLGQLPELVARLHVAHLPNLAVRYRAMDITDGEERLPIPLNEHADALTRLLDHELRTWADAVADTAGLVEAGEWHPDLWDRMRVGVRVTQACELLHHRHTQWLAHGPIEYRARSLGAHRVDGLDEDAVTFNGRDAWITRTGGEAAAHLLGLANRARTLAVPDGTDWIPVPCRRCKARRLHRHHRRRLVVCHGCGDERTDDAHDEFLAAALGDPPPAPHRPAPPEWLPQPCTACGLRQVWWTGPAIVCRACHHPQHAPVAAVTAGGGDAPC